MFEILTPHSRRSFLSASTLALTTSRWLSFGSFLEASTGPSAPLVKAIKSAVNIYGSRLHYDFELGSCALTYRINFSRYSPEYQKSLLRSLDLNAYDTAEDFLILEDLLPGLMTNNNPESAFQLAMNFFNPGYRRDLKPNEVEAKEKENLALFGRILNIDPQTRGAKYTYERVADTLERIFTEREVLADTMSSSRTPNFAGKSILRVAMEKGPEFLKNNLWMRLYRKRGELTDKTSSLRTRNSESNELKKAQSELDENGKTLDKMNGVSEPAHIKFERKPCVALSIISPQRKLSLKIEELAKEENVDLVIVKEFGTGFLYSGSKGIIEFIDIKLFPKESESVLTFEKGSRADFIEVKINSL